MGHRCQRIRGCPMGVKHERAWAIASKPLFGIILQANGSNRTELLSLFDDVQPLSGAGLKWRGQDGAITKSARSNLVTAVRPPQNQVTGQHVGDGRNARFPLVELSSIDSIVCQEMQPGIDIPRDLGITGEMELRVDGCA